MRKKRETHSTPTYTKYNNNDNNKSRHHYSILVKHENKLNNFTENNNKIEILMKSINNIQNELIVLNINTKKSKELIEKKNKILNDINSLKQNCNEIEEYILESYDIINKYVMLEEYENQLLHKDSNNEELYKIHLYKMDIIDDYLLKFDKNYISKKSLLSYNDICHQCGINFDIHDISNAIAVCTKCGITAPLLFHDNYNPSFKEAQDLNYRPQFTYMKESHLLEHLRRFQAMEKKNIPQEILDKVILEARKEKIKDLNTLTESKVKLYLKKLKLSEYYDNVITIINRINGRPSFILTSEIENKIKLIFKQIQPLFDKYKPVSRKNFFSYPYIVHKLLELLDLHEYAKYFPLLKSTDKLRQQDDIFKKIVTEMASKDKTINWVFYPSI